MLSFFRVVSFAIQDILRNVSLSFMTIFVLVLMTLSLNSLVVMYVLTDKATTAIEEKIDVTIYFDHEATSEDIEEVISYIKSFPEVVSTVYLGVDDVIAEFTEFHKDNPDILASLEELDQNPLGATLVIKTANPNDYSRIIEALQVPEYDAIIEAKSFGDTQKAIDRVNTITTQVQHVTLLFSALFSLVAFLVIFNTVRVAIFTQRIEISIKKLVGATNWFIRGPYIISAFLFSVAAIIISYAVSLLLFGFVDPYVTVVFGEYAILTNYFLSHILLIAGIEFLCVLSLTILSSSFAMRKYLQV